jgi:putative AbiEi antitoxin of type IV toxin-antitoxin system
VSAGVFVYAEIAEQAADQYGLVTRQQALAAGFTRARLEHLLASGRWRRVASGVYLIGGAPFVWQAKLLAPCLAGGPKALASHRSAAALWGLVGFDPPARPQITVPFHRRSRIGGAKVHEAKDYELCQPEIREGIRVTGTARTVLDLYASERNLDVARRGLFSARKKKLVTWTGLAACLETHARPGRRGISRLRADLATYSVVGCPESGFQDHVVALLVGAGLPLPHVEHWVTTSGRRYRLDIAYPEPRVLVECKSKQHHLTDEAFEADPVRDADLAIDGWIVIHVTWGHLRNDPDGVLRRVRKALVRRGGVAA